MLTHLIAPAAVLVPNHSPISLPSCLPTRAIRWTENGQMAAGSSKNQDTIWRYEASSRPISFDSRMSPSVTAGSRTNRQSTSMIGPIGQFAISLSTRSTLTSTQMTSNQAVGKQALPGSEHTSPARIRCQASLCSATGSKTDPGSYTGNPRPA